MSLLLSEKEDLDRTMRMFESLNREHRIAISAGIDAYRREEMMNVKEGRRNVKKTKKVQTSFWRQRLATILTL